MIADRWLCFIHALYLTYNRQLGPDHVSEVRCTCGTLWNVHVMWITKPRIMSGSRCLVIVIIPHARPDCPPQSWIWTGGSYRSMMFLFNHTPSVYWEHCALDCLWWRLGGFSNCTIQYICLTSWINSEKTSRCVIGATQLLVFVLWSYHQLKKL